MSRPARVPPSLRGGPFRGSAAIRDGLLTAAQLRGSAWRRLFYDTYVHAACPDSHLLRVRAASLLLPPGAVVTGRSAAHIWGVGFAGPEDAVEVLTPQRMRPQHGLDIRSGSVAVGEIARVGGIAVPKPAHTAWEIARALAPIDAIAWLDALARTKRLSVADLTDHARRHYGEYGGRSATATLALVNPLAESPPESRLRVHIGAAGLPVPKPQWNVYVNGVFIARVDLAWPDLRFAVEYDGQWHADPAQLARDRRRLRALNAAGWHIYPVTSADLHDVPQLIRQLSAALADRRAAIG